MAFNSRKKQAQPFKQLIAAMNRVVEGQYPTIGIDRNAPFAELTHSFNRMLKHVNHKVSALETLSYLDHQIAAHLDVDQVKQTVIENIATLIPESCVVVLTVENQTESQTTLNSCVASNIPVELTRLNISQQELNVFKANPKGLFIEQNTNHLWDFTKVFNCEAAYFWGYPIRFDGKCLALIIVKHTQALRKTPDLWQQVKDLSDRIGVALLAQKRKDALLLQSQYDELTSLPNRILLQDRVKLAIEHSDHVKQPFWLLYLDLDRFKYVNDALGHKAGDNMLKVLSVRLSNILEDTDTLARFVGDEFVILLSSQSSDAQRMRLVHQIMEQIQHPYLVNGTEVVVTGSVGIAVYPNDGASSEAMIKHADTAMYRAKEKGKNTFSFFKQAVNKRVIDRLQMEMQLRKAIDNDELKLNYQPKINLNTGQIVGMEALVVWHSEAFGVVPSQHFILLAEETGLITAIGEWALNTACRQTVKWQTLGYQDLLVSVNLSAKQFTQKNLAQTVARILKESQLDAHHLELELTESVIMNKAEQAIDLLTQIKALGVSLSIDDFGTGYSSLSYLQNLPIDTLKIDKSFTDAITDKDAEAPIVLTMLTLAKNLHLKVVTEGVETIEQAQFLKQHNCDELQGYVFSKPVDADAFEALLRQKAQLQL